MGFFTSSTKKQNKTMGIRTPTGVDDMLLWLDGSTIEADASDNCYRWRSKTNGFFLDNTGSLSDMPDLVTNHVNGHNSLFFDNLQYLEARPGGVNTDLILAGSGSNCPTIFVVWLPDPDEVGTDGVLGWGLTGDDTNVTEFLIHSSQQGARLRYNTVGSTQNLDSMFSLRDGEYHITSVRFGSEDDAWIMRTDGKTDNQLGGNGNIQDGLIDSFEVGRRPYGSSYYKGHIAEIMIYDRALSDTDIVKVEEYLFAKYFSPENLDDLFEWFKADEGVQT